MLELSDDIYVQLLQGILVTLIFIMTLLACIALNQRVN